MSNGSRLIGYWALVLISAALRLWALLLDRCSGMPMSFTRCACR
jgi:hypothetical protein